MTLDHEDIEAIAEAVAKKLGQWGDMLDEVEHMAKLIGEGRGDEVRAKQRAKLLSSRPRRARQ